MASLSSASLLLAGLVAHYLTSRGNVLRHYEPSGSSTSRQSVESGILLDLDSERSDRGKCGRDDTARMAFRLWTRSRTMYREQ